jgi:hypothetical protein
MLSSVIKLFATLLAANAAGILLWHKMLENDEKQELDETFRRIIAEKMKYKYHINIDSSDNIESIKAKVIKKGVSEDEFKQDVIESVKEVEEDYM